MCFNVSNITICLERFKPFIVNYFSFTLLFWWKLYLFPEIFSHQEVSVAVAKYILS